MKPPKPSQEMRRINQMVCGGGKSTTWLRDLNAKVKTANYKRTEEAIARDAARRKVGAIAEFRRLSDDLKEVWE